MVQEQSSGAVWGTGGRRFKSGRSDHSFSGPVNASHHQETAERPMAAYFCYVTAPSRDAALTIGRAVVEERLAACANVLDGMTSIYWWQGALEQADEAVLILKTRAALVEPLIARIRELHSYECPCVVALPIAAGNQDYLDWIDRETASASTA
jgi:periplasmic divalent cation tolerance protein